jgi:methionyl-tRNA formyltransferase
METARKNSGVIFFGSPDFAIPSLKALSASEYRPDLVVTQPDRPAGRGKKSSPTPVRRVAEEEDLPVRIMESFRAEGAIEALETLDPAYLVVVAFGIIFPARALGIASRANINLHASLLPAYRGASPINAAIVGSERYTGVTTMEMVEELDAGPIYLQRRTPIDPMESAGDLSARLSISGAELLLETLRGLDGGMITPREQPKEGVSHAPRLRKEDGYIDWNRDAAAVHDNIRGMNPWPGSFTYHKASGRKALGVEEFLNGYSIESGDTFGREDVK